MVLLFAFRGTRRSSTSQPSAITGASSAGSGSKVASGAVVANNEDKMAIDTLEELDWCLDQLETIQAHRSVGDMATSKFKRMLNKELSHFSESKSGSQISEFLLRTYVGKSPDLNFPQF